MFINHIALFYFHKTIPCLVVFTMKAVIQNGTFLNSLLLEIATYNAEKKEDRTLHGWWPLLQLSWEEESWGNVHWPRKVVSISFVRFRDFKQCRV